MRFGSLKQGIQGERGNPIDPIREPFKKMMISQEKVRTGKLFHKIGEVGQLTGLEPYVLRFWESEFTALRPKKNPGGQRVYIDRDIQVILRIKRMLYEEGYTIAGAKKRFVEKRASQKEGQNKEGKPDLIHRIKEELEDILQSLGPKDN